MSSLEFDRRKKADAQLNIAPLIDIVFLLLVFFVLSSHFVNEKGFRIKLPKAAHAANQSSAEITVLIDNSNTIYVNQRETGFHFLEEELKRELSSDDKKIVLIKADETVDIGVVVRVMDIARGLAAEGLVISTKVFDDEKNE